MNMNAKQINNNVLHIHPVKLVIKDLCVEVVQINSVISLEDKSV